jgi:hypothetical protein
VDTRRKPEAVQDEFKAVPDVFRTALWTTLALLAFSANSLLCRLALRHALIDPASFTTVRLVAGAVTLALLTRLQSGSAPSADPSWSAAAMLFLYAAPFSFAYGTLTTGTGALLLFGAVQVTMILGALLAGDRPKPQWLISISLPARVLVLPGSRRVPPLWLM